MKLLFSLLLLVPLFAAAQCKVDSFYTNSGKSIPAIAVPTEAGELILAKEDSLYYLKYRSDQFSNRRSPREMLLNIREVTFHFLDRSSVSFKCIGFGKVAKNMSLAIQFTSLEFTADLSPEEFERLTSKKISTFSVTGDRGSTGGDVIFRGHRQDIIDSFYCLNALHFYKASTIPSQASSTP
ncbi:hypothetical protein [Pedobacter sp. SYSU D00535]|uniref:hypothetical protein n=1 Tax=Pedobacter sp. SYSU D00535 TaxID=2810308 RepID=UPI001A96E0FB|nr:hypothetical protein [Pedobacter sp. SYSU D00535]